MSTADCEEMKALAVSNAEAAFKSHQHRVSNVLMPQAVSRNFDVFVFHLQLLLLFLYAGNTILYLVLTVVCW